MILLFNLATRYHNYLVETGKKLDLKEYEDFVKKETSKAATLEANKIARKEK